jgi:hypothetical protein
LQRNLDAQCYLRRRGRLAAARKAQMVDEEVLLDGTAEALL